MFEADEAAIGTSSRQSSQYGAIATAEVEEHITMAGLVQRELGHLPIVGEAVEFDGARITVLEVDGYRLERLRIEKLNGGVYSKPPSVHCAFRPRGRLNGVSGPRLRSQISP